LGIKPPSRQSWEVKPWEVSSGIMLRREEAREEEKP
jgi:hypothetical protein